MSRVLLKEQEAIHHGEIRSTTYSYTEEGGERHTLRIDFSDGSVGTFSQAPNVSDQVYGELIVNGRTERDGALEIKVGNLVVADWQEALDSVRENGKAFAKDVDSYVHKGIERKRRESETYFD